MPGVVSAKTTYAVSEGAYDCIGKDKNYDDITITKGKKGSTIKTIYASDETINKIKGFSCFSDLNDEIALAETKAKMQIDPNHALYKAMTSKYVNPDKLCVTDLGGRVPDKSDECAYISRDFGICDTHAYNAGYDTNPEDSSERDFIREVVGLKVTVISQQMYKQYEYLNATLKRLKTQLQKSVLNAKLEMAGAKSESSGGSSGGGYKTYLAGADNCTNKMNKNAAYPCIQNNLNLIINATDTNVNQARKQLADTLEAAEAWEITDKDHPAPDACKSTSKADIKKCAQLMNVKVSNKIDKLKNKSNGQIIQLGLQSNQ